MEMFPARMFNFAFIIPINAIIFGCSIAIIAIIMEYKEKKKYYESLVKALETGKNPEKVKELFEQPQKKEYDKIRYMKRGIITIGVGIGLGIIGWVVGSLFIVGVGAFLCVLGLSLLFVHHVLNKNRKSVQ